MKSENDRLRDALVERRRQRRREDRFEVACNVLVIVMGAALVCAVLGLIAMKRGEAREAKLLDESRAVTSYLAGGAA